MQRNNRRIYIIYPLPLLAICSRCSSLDLSRCEDGTTVLPWSSPTRSEQLERMEKEQFDVLVIGGGCVGAGVAWEAATRGLKVAMVERDDFAAGTSGRSTKLIHGGIRYLEAAVWGLDYEMYKLVHEALTEARIGVEGLEAVSRVILGKHDT